MAIGACFFILWNLWAFSGHFFDLFIAAANIILLPGAMIPSLIITSWKEPLYYALKMDHLLCVPALFFFYLGLREMILATEDRTRHEGGQ